METTMNMHFNPAPPPLSSDTQLQAASTHERTFDKPVLRGIGRIAGTLRRVGKVFGIWLVRRHAMRALQMLDDRTLADIGVRRGEIPGIATRVARYGTIHRKDL
jgi:uncharacterized protein YjiS (DUF1127 family)